ncbi:G2/M phase-specific E3 ubiquitin-protein ligase-like [Alosa pseudoharengus]|uniref:G2/M phase-specific E3 ubiquitin-protein ligase-like n=1 Tax=Alosa pseudoharengus TaxID=34774 RepID=UPI003F896BD3
MALTINENVLRRMLKSYRCKDLTVQEIINVIILYNSLKPVMELYVFNDGSSRELMSLTGTVPISYRGNTYNIPICVWLLDTYPYNPPICYVRPTSTMMIKTGKHVDANGKVYLPYLHEWKHPQSDLFSLIQVMILLFGEEPPVFSQPTTQTLYQAFQTAGPTADPSSTSSGDLRQRAARGSLAGSLPTISSEETDKAQSLEYIRLQEELSLCEILETFSIKNKEDGSTPVVVRRKSVLKDALTLCKKSYFSWKRTPHVEFIGEEAADFGGPMKEFFRLLMMDVASTYGVFEGPQDKLLFTYDLSALEDGKYRTAGMLIAWSVLHNGPGIRALHPALFQIMCTQKADLQHFDFHDIPNEKVQSNLQKIQQCVTEEQFMSLCSELGDWISDCGVPRIFTAKIKDIPRIFEQVVKYYIYFRTASVIHQFIEGMNICGNLWSQVERNWVAFLPIFTNTSGEMSLSSFKGLYKMSWSPQGSNQRRREEETMFGWEMFLIAIQEKATDVTFKDLLVFWTGMDSVPSLGFSRQPVIEFYEREGSSRIPYASTCSLTLFLPRGVEEEMDALLTIAIKESFDFENVKGTIHC